jgi:hypothetical protein
MEPELKMSWFLWLWGSFFTFLLMRKKSIIPMLSPTGRIERISVVKER